MSNPFPNTRQEILRDASLESVTTVHLPCFYELSELIHPCMFFTKGDDVYMTFLDADERISHLNLQSGLEEGLAQNSRVILCEGKIKVKPKIMIVGS